MTWLDRLQLFWARFLDWWHEVGEPFDLDYPDSSPPVPDDMAAPDTEPTSPGALDSDHGRLMP